MSENRLPIARNRFCRAATVRERLPNMRVKRCHWTGRLRSLTHRLAFVVTALLAAAPLLAQNAELSGSITDPSGLAVPGARVVVRSADTGGARTVSSNQQGEYSVPAL